MNHRIWNQNKVNIDETFTYNIAMNVMDDNEDPFCPCIYMKILEMIIFIFVFIWKY